MARQSASSLALIVRSQPYGQRVARANIDLALSAAALDFDLRLYFQGSSILQLASGQNTAGALLPAGYRAWAALPGLADTNVYADSTWLEFCVENEIDLVMPVEALSTVAMKKDWRNCSHVMVI